MNEFEERFHVKYKTSAKRVSVQAGDPFTADEFIRAVRDSEDRMKDFDGGNPDFTFHSLSWCENS